MVRLFLLTLKQLKKLIKMIVARNFYCIKTKKNWKKGAKYTGKRKDLGDALVADKDFEKAEDERLKANEKIAKADDKRLKKIGQFGTAKHKAPKGKK